MNFIGVVYRRRHRFHKTASLAEQLPDDSTVGWEKLTQAQVRVFCLIGGHQTILKDPHLQKLVAEIKEAFVTN